MTAASAPAPAPRPGGGRSSPQSARGCTRAARAHWRPIVEPTSPRSRPAGWSTRRRRGASFESSAAKAASNVRTLSHRHADREGILGRRHAAQHMRIEVRDGRSDRSPAACAIATNGVDGPTRTVSYAYSGSRLNVQAVAGRLLRDQRSSDELRDVVLRLHAQVLLVREREEQIVARRPLEIVSEPRQPARDATGTAVVCRGSQVDRANWSLR